MRIKPHVCPVPHVCPSAQAWWHLSFWRRSSLSPLSRYDLRPNYNKGTQPHPFAENWIKDLMSMAPPIRARLTLPHSQSLWSGSFCKPLILIQEGRQNENHNHRKLIKQITWITALSNSMKPWATPCRDTQGGQVMVESLTNHGPLEKGMKNYFSNLSLRTPWTVWKDKKMILKDELTRSCPICYQRRMKK